MNDPFCTIVIVPRDRFSLAEASYDSICAHNPDQYPVVYVDSCHPKPWADRLDRLAAEKKLTLIRTGFHLSQNEAYNLAMPQVRSKYVCFVDNDPHFRAGCLENLLRCAEETGAAAVMPLIEEKEDGGDWRVHMCGGDCGVAEKEGNLVYMEIHPFNKQARPEDLPRCQTGLLECHTFLVRTEALRRVGPFDENILMAACHADFSLMLRASGGTIWVEPAAAIRFQIPPPMEVEDIPFFITTWSHRRAVDSLRYFAAKWGVRMTPTAVGWMRFYRRRTHSVLRRLVQARFGAGIAGKIFFRLAWAMEPLFSWMMERWNRVPDRRERLEALGTWRAPGLDRARIEAFAASIFDKPRPLLRELPTDDSGMNRAAG